MASVSVFKIKENIDKISVRKNIDLTGTTPKQSQLAEFNIIKKLPQPHSEIKFIEEKSGYIKYKIKHESNTIFDEIKVYKWDVFEDTGAYESSEHITNKGYQIIREFNVLVNQKAKLVYVFSKKDDAKIFMMRLKNNLDIDYEPVELDLSKIDEIPEIIDEYGAWVNDSGNVMKHGHFGHKVKKYMEGNEHNVTSYNVVYDYGDEINIYLVISKEGRISSQSKFVKEAVLLKIFGHLKEKLEMLQPPTDD